MTSKLLSELNAEHFKNAVIILDIDGAIVPDKTSDISAAAERFVKLLAETNEVHLVSNGKRHERNAKLAHRLGVSYFETPHKKPTKRAVLHILENQSGRPVIVIGDKFLTDGFLAMRIKAEFVKVKRLTSGKEGAFTFFVNFIDDAIYAIYQKLEKGFSKF
ncbi:hypothetical protein A3A20_00335 [Candidatus Wolfebacteria bacterium RIFCSPLOWO2_01_FULL_45_19]|uniref:HAD family hydrolase n=1 Tax=Candidatus Wolfebacteria bacterium RIFCSPLOWO2_01_FULL_45_19 TaxID=1802557 RepID=A0A1F8DQZ3_9BACT|nr:MAG: hypothetical protein UX23_C0014G0011 [Parcubacteria group bacterium GW2011_GWB1_45_9]OGM91014.1 MAG: hypothetical protein A3A20_00335 [Candidatus Wolfebacteria bacterium RIFCSPLOWO2_01_FULL_45_19]